jgi:hypothetical protein
MGAVPTNTRVSPLIHDDYNKAGARRLTTEFKNPDICACTLL